LVETAQKDPAFFRAVAGPRFSEVHKDVDTKLETDLEWVEKALNGGIWVSLGRVGFLVAVIVTYEIGSQVPRVSCHIACGLC
jgi:hypothetical protein